ncbi:efflux RND transporter periplasmic adaptor subunit [Marinilongibacter aquaticus]|uniref:efflux RND transporter periplasmic adaptor subunit n=1 Tax=Marinilongibacter aquaticus TaxID=2975157 RepID=UPI0021BDE588|nr:efflux RND transporter periplasmic adaptor subunit [Marinilongibacter aquaticus]UBM60228.1 efflux RND transporter periplasmic adaptor subunit [Marinilongibacter aquaticus]
MKKTYKFLYPLFCILLFACQEQSTVEEKKVEKAPLQANSNVVTLNKAQIEHAQIALGRVEEREMGSEIEVSGLVDVPPKSKVSITIPYGGFIKTTSMLPGSRIKKGQILLEIENPDFIQFQEDYLEALTQRDFLKAEFDRQKTLHDEQIASGKNFQKAQSQYEANEVRIKGLKARLELIGFDVAKIESGQITSTVAVHSPINGSVREVHTNIGKYVNPQDDIMDLTNAEDLHIELTAYEDQIPKIKQGQRIRFTLASDPDNIREAKVFLVGSGVREDRSVTVHGHMSKHYPDLLPGMYIAAKIETGRHQAFAVPEPSVVRFAGKYYVFVRKTQTGDNQSFEMKEIKKGLSEEGFTQIESTESKDSLLEYEIVTNGAMTLLGQAKIPEEEE